MTVILHDAQYTFFIISRSVLLRMRNVSDKTRRENQNTRFMSNNLSQKSYRLWDNVEKYGRTRQATDENMAYIFALHAGALSLQTHTQNI